MDRILYLAMAAAKHSQIRQTSITNNIANASTDGFKKDFMSMMAIEGNATRKYSSISSTTPQMNQGPVRGTGNPMDITIKDGYISSLAMDGTKHYLTSASINVNVDGQLVDAKQNLILNDMGQSVEVGNARSISIGQDGGVTIIPRNGTDTDTTNIGTIGIVDIDGKLNKDLKGRLVSSADTVPSVAGIITSGTLEGSNVVMAQEMLDMIETNRQYEQSVKLMKTIQDMHSASTKLLR